MSEISSVPNRLNLLGSIGLLLIGVASILFALAFFTKSFGTEVRVPDFPENNPGYEIVTAGEATFLLDKKSGEVWERNESWDVWCTQYVQGVKNREISPYERTTNDRARFCN